jgi:hypothetical protein
LATLSVHQQTVFSLELTAEELTKLQADTAVHGLIEDSEQTYLEVCRFGDLYLRPELDWTTLGMLTQVLSQLR